MRVAGKISLNAMSHTAKVPIWTEEGFFNTDRISMHVESKLHCISLKKITHKKMANKLDVDGR